MASTSAGRASTRVIALHWTPRDPSEGLVVHSGPEGGEGGYIVARSAYPSPLSPVLFLYIGGPVGPEGPQCSRPRRDGLSVRTYCPDPLRPKRSVSKLWSVVVILFVVCVSRNSLAILHSFWPSSNTTVRFRAFHVMRPFLTVVVTHIFIFLPL